VSSPTISELPYRPDSADLFEAIAHDPWAVFLDSGHPAGSRGRYDVLAAAPTVTLSTRGALTTVHSGEGTVLSRRDPLELLCAHLGPPAAAVDGLPFSGGAMGYFAYDLGRRLESLPDRAADAERLPEMAVGIYDWAVVVDHDLGRTRLVSHHRDPRTARVWADLIRRFTDPAPARTGRPWRMLGPVRSNMDPDGYRQAFNRIEHYIREGDCYQVNLAQRFSAPAAGDPWQAYRRLRAANPAPFAAYLSGPHWQVLSASPEQFLNVVDRVVTTRPIKGTRPRSSDPARDRALAAELQASAKDRAENVMIVDLLRNDLGRCCETGTVRVPRLFELESFATVHHLVSTVTGRLAPGCSPTDLLRACFPGGSITGAPKLRSMEIIEELEPHRRGVYCGAIGYIGFDGRMDTNIAIRTAVYSDGVIRFWAGGGIVADSCPAREYQETFDKAASFLSVFSEAVPPAKTPARGAGTGHLRLI